MLTGWLANWIERIADSLPAGFWLAAPYQIRALVAVVLLAIICGAVGSQVVGNQMAFLSDALAHCAFAGVTLGVLLSFAAEIADQQHWFVPVVMVGCGILVGFAIAFVKENTALSSDTVIGVFFACVLGLGIMLIDILRRSSYLNPESFLFGSILAVDEWDIVILGVLLIITAATIGLTYNSILFSSFSPSLARSRGIRVRLWNYALIVILALIINLSLKAVGALLINALLVVPAATAANLSRSARGMFWWTMSVAVFSGVVGLYLSNYDLPVGHGEPLHLTPSGIIVELCVASFFLSLMYRMVRDRRRPALPH
jgi:zinc transport system permease protein